MSGARAFDYTREEVMAAFQVVKANKGAAGIDGQTLAQFEEHLSANIYKVWNRLSSGSYFPPSVKGKHITETYLSTREKRVPCVSMMLRQATLGKLV
jgi:RNA-directed DNA polymerase